MWSPFSQDLIITGSADFTLRIWRVSKQTIVMPSKATSKNKKTKKKKANETESWRKTANDESNVVVGSEKKILEIEPAVEETENSHNHLDKFSKKKKIKKVTHFPVYAEISNNSRLWCSMVQNLLNELKNENQLGELDAFDYKEIEQEKCEPEKLNEDIPFLMGTKKNLVDSLQYESNNFSLEFY